MTVHIETVGRGAPLILLHGWAMHSGLWTPLLSPLANRFQLHLVDLPGHGHSGAVEPHTLDEITGAVARALDTVRSPLTLLGWSLGGAVALAWARAAPSRIARLILTGTTPCFVQRPDWPHAMASTTLHQFGDELRVSYRLTLQRFVSLQVQGSDQGRAVLAQLRAHLFARGEPSPDALAAALDVLASVDLRDQVGAIDLPVRLIAGDRDMLTPLAAAKWLAQALPRGSLRIIRGAAHAPFLSHPDAFVAAMLEAEDHGGR